MCENTEREYVSVEYKWTLGNDRSEFSVLQIKSMWFHMDKLKF